MLKRRAALICAAGVIGLASVLVPSSAAAQARCAIASAGCVPRTPQAVTAVTPPERPRPTGPLTLAWPERLPREQPQPFGPLKLVYPGTRPEAVATRDPRSDQAHGPRGDGDRARHTWLVPRVRPGESAQRASAQNGAWGPSVTFQPSEHDLWQRDWWKRPTDGVPLDSSATVRLSGQSAQRALTAEELERMRDQRRLEDATLTVLSGMQPSALVAAARGAARQRCVGMATPDEQRACLLTIENR
ncbi:MAG: hypothetical protein ABL986_20810 [Vicinamibacterales bacterium]